MRRIIATIAAAAVYAVPNVPADRPARFTVRAQIA